MPRATYRLQLTARHGFDHAARVADYLARLGVSHLYTSPFFQAAPGSTHGYDGVDPEHISADLGGEQGFENLCRQLKQSQLGLLIDIVPNHLSIASRQNWRWWDVLRQGRQSRYADWFDIDWQAPQARQPGQVLLPVLGDHLGVCLEVGEIKLVPAQEQPSPAGLNRQQSTAVTAGPDSPTETQVYPEDRVEVAYYDHRFPVAPGSIPQLSAPDGDNSSIGSPANLQQVLERINSSANAMEQVLRAQHYRLAFWKSATDDLNYRRFFAINELVGVRVEVPHVFDVTHRRALELVRQGLVEGLRVDHPDGLRNPTGYLQRLREQAPEAWLTVEKILQPNESLPEEWPVDGTTGYEFLNQVGGLWTDPRGEAALSSFYAAFTGSSKEFPEVLVESKTHVARKLFGSEFTRLVHLLASICEHCRRYRDYTWSQVRAALELLLVFLPVYRTYITPTSTVVSEPDRRAIEQAAAEAKTTINRLSPCDVGLLEFIRKILLLQVDAPQVTEFIARFQQLSGPLMAKGAEDTAFYRYNRFVAINEVGGDPGCFATSLADFHRIMAHDAGRRPATMRTTSTHDTKRSEDVRSRLSLLAQIPQQWAAAVRRWDAMAVPLCVAGRPDANERYLIYQTLVGAWPISAQRMRDYLIKANREAKRHTSWLNPDQTHEQWLEHFVDKLLQREEFVAALQEFVAPLVEPGRLVSLAQTLVKMIVPGVPDIYQGCELEDLSLVDPDNRNPVDFDRRRALLDELIALERQGRVDTADLFRRADEGLPKMFVIRRSLAVRAALPRVFSRPGGYLPLWAFGPRADHAVGFARTLAPDADSDGHSPPVESACRGRGEAGHAHPAVIAIVPRWPISLGDDWQGTCISLPDGQWRSALSQAQVSGGGRMCVAELLQDFPLGLFVRADLLDASPFDDVLRKGFQRG